MVYKLPHRGIKSDFSKTVEKLPFIRKYERIVLMVNFPYFLSNIFLSGSNFVIFVLKYINGILLSICAKKLSKFYVDEKVHQKCSEKWKSLRENQWEK